MENTKKLYGIVEGYENISFVLDGFQCVFLILIQNQKYLLPFPRIRDLFWGEPPDKNMYIFIPMRI